MWNGLSGILPGGEGLHRMISLDSVLSIIKEQNSVFRLFTFPLSSNSVSFVSWHVALEVYV